VAINGTDATAPALQDVTPAGIAALPTRPSVRTVPPPPRCQRPFAFEPKAWKVRVMGKLVASALLVALSLPGCRVANERSSDCPEVQCAGGLRIAFSPALLAPGRYQVAVVTEPVDYGCEATVDLVDTGWGADAGGCSGAPGVATDAVAAGHAGVAGRGCQATQEVRVTQPQRRECFSVIADEVGVQGLWFSEPLPGEVTVVVSRDGQRISAATFTPEYTVFDPECFPACRGGGEEMAVGR
jgi:hypothetical protein